MMMKNMWIEGIREEAKRIANGECDPRFLVMSERIGSAFLTEESVIFWCGMMYAVGVDCTIMDCAEYDWETNPQNIQFNHDSETIKRAMRAATTH